ncbi:hypothetical protein GCM10009851_14130 [Herbiconiux moechotypicola]|uniref:Uncharacterized protein n=1 Tax=Herbiconiux moechotypicola TaxID=637393 RepID=A0ABN3DGG7_9MICO
MNACLAAELGDAHLGEVVLAEELEEGGRQCFMGSGRSGFGQIDGRALSSGWCCG